MNKRNLIVVAGSILTLSMSSAAYAAQGVYVSGNLGVAMPSDIDATDSTTPGLILSIESDPGYALGAAVGYDFGNNIRIEGEFSYQQSDIDKISVLGFDLDSSGDSSAFGIGLNGYYDFTNKSSFTPFITAGAGLAKVEIDDFAIAGTSLGSEDDTVFAYQFGAGLAYAVTETVNIDLTYRYRGFDDPEFGTTTVEYGSHNVYAGVRVAF